MLLSCRLFFAAVQKESAQIERGLEPHIEHYKVRPRVKAHSASRTHGSSLIESTPIDGLVLCKYVGILIGTSSL